MRKYTAYGDLFYEDDSKSLLAQKREVYLVAEADDRIEQLITRVHEARLVWGMVCKCQCSGCTGFDAELTKILKEFAGEDR